VARKLELGVDITVEGARELGKVADSLSGTSDELDDLALKLDDAADAARRASDDIDAAAGSLRFEGASAGAETLENAGEGLRNFANGASDAFTAATDSSLGFQERFTLAAGGVADVANGMRNAIIPALQAVAAGSLRTMVASVASFGAQVAGWIASAAAATAGAATIAVAWLVAFGPVALIVAAVIAAVALIILNWDKVVAFIGGAVDFMVELLSGFAEFFVGVWEGMMEFLAGIGDAIADIGATLWEPIGAGFEAVVDFIRGVWNAFARWWNGIEIAVPSVDIPIIGRVGGFSIGLPDLPYLAAGGIVTGPTLAMLGEAGPEAVVPLDRLAGAGGVTVHVTVNGNLEARDELTLSNTISRSLWAAGYGDRLTVEARPR
jgi:hypothetical protein